MIGKRHVLGISVFGKRQGTSVIGKGRGISVVGKRHFCWG